MTVDHELLEFENELWDALELTLVTGPNWEYWREVDLPQTLFLDDVRRVIEDAHAPMIEKYRGTAAEPILRNSQQFIYDIVWAGMNVPFPNAPELHAANVCDNAIHLYNIRIYARLRTELIMVNHNASVLQRKWRRVISDPSHPACRRRLEFEFSILEQYRV